MSEIEMDMKEVDRLKAQRQTKKQEVDQMDEVISKVRLIKKIINNWIIEKIKLIFLGKKRSWCYCQRYPGCTKASDQFGE